MFSMPVLVIVTSDKEQHKPSYKTSRVELMWFSISDTEVVELCASLPLTINDCRGKRPLKWVLIEPQWDLAEEMSDT